MIPAQPTSDEARRIEELHDYGVLDTPPEQALDDLTSLAAQICGTPIAMISLVDEERLWFKAKVGTHLTQTARDVSFCGHAVQQRDLFIVPDALQDERFADNPLVTGEPGIRFYAGAPLVSPKDAALGALCVIDHVPRTLTPEQQRVLKVLAQQVMIHLELHRHTRELTEREEQLRLFVEHSPVAVAMFDRDMKYLVASHRWVDDFLLGGQSIIGRSHYDIFPEIPPRWVEIHRRCLEGAIEKCSEEPFPRIDGSTNWLRWEVRPWRRADGAIGGIIIFSEDITERKREEMASLRLGAIVEYSDDAIIGKDLNSIVTSWNQGAERIFGYTSGEMVGTSIMRLIPADRQEEEEHILGQIRRGESVNHFETIRQTKDGRLINVSVTASPIKNAAGQPIGVSKIARDITRRKQTEDRLTLLDACVSNLNDIVLVTEAEPIDEPGPRIVFVNEAFERLTGYTSAETLGRSPRFLQGEKTDRRVLKEIRDALAQRQPIRRQILNYGKDGAEYWLDMDIVPIVNAAGKCAHFAAIERDITGEKKAEESLKLFRTLIDRSNDAIEVVDAETGRFIDVNETACRRLGYSREEMLALCVRDILDEGSVSSSMQTEVEEIRRAGSKIIEGRHRRKDGSTFPIEVNIQYIDLDRGYLISVVRDITERKQAEEARRLTEARYSTLFEYAPDGILIATPEGVYLDANARMCRMLGYTCGELIGLHASDIVAQTEVPHIGSALRDITAKLDHQREWLFRRKDDSTFAAEVIATMMPDGNLLAMIRDITERKQAQGQIAQQAAFLDKATDAIIAIDLGKMVLFWNRGAEHMYGWTREEVTGRDVSELFYHNPKKFEDITSLTISRGEWSGEIAQLTKHRGEIIVESRRTLIRDNEGRPTSILIINTDITDKKKIEAQFMRAQRMESIGTLAGGVAHDLNNILAPIMMSIDILKTISDSPQAVKILETIEVSAKRGADIVRQVLSFARGLEGQRIEVQPKHLLKDLENIIKDTFPKDIHLQFSIPTDIWTILGDPTQVHQILLNLCVNARDAMPNGGTLIVAVENCVLDEQYAGMNLQAKPGRYVNISVTDTGTGIPPALIDKIFEPFFTTKELNKGTGLGLSTVMAIVKSHDGIVNVYSEPGKGTTFKVYLPAMEISSEARKEQTETANLPRGNGETVLVVDDEASILTITSQTLQAFGYRVLTATDGADAVAVYAEHRNEIAVVLTDMAMPVMDGPAAIHALTRMNPAIKIVAASGFTANGGAIKASGAGVKHFLTKPYTAGTLLKTIRTILDEA
jgi:PAS domain S-box-containing protein